MLAKPILALCADRNSLAKSAPLHAIPETWFSNEQLAGRNLSALSFDFFVNWNTNPPELTPVIWIKRLLAPQYSYEDLLKNLPEIIIEEFTVEYLDKLVAFSNKFNLTAQFVIFKDDQNWKDEASTIILVSINRNDKGLTFSPEKVSITEFKNLIKKYAGGAVQIGTKGLTYGTSNLECSLATTDAAYPGDADEIILDENINPVTIIENKKHTLGTSIDGQKLSNFYPAKDARKYNRLAILRDYLGSISNTPVSLINIYYPTTSNEKNGKIEILDGEQGKLFAWKHRIFEIPTKDDPKMFDDTIEHLLAGITAFQKEKTKTK